MNSEMTFLLQFDLIIVVASVVICPLILWAKTSGKRTAPVK